MALPVITRLRQRVSSAISGMTTPTYNYNWSSVNQWDETKAVGMLSANVHMHDYEPVGADSEQGNDLYELKAEALIKVNMRISDYSYEDAMTSAEKASNDLMRLFGNVLTMEDTAYIPRFLGMNFQLTMDKNKPISFEQRWVFDLSFSRIDPTVIGV